MSIMRDDVSIFSIFFLAVATALLIILCFFEAENAKTDLLKYRADERIVKSRYLQEKMDQMEKELEKDKPQGVIKEEEKIIPQKEIYETVKNLLDKKNEEYLQTHKVTKKTTRKYLEEMYYYILSQDIEGIQLIRMEPEYMQLEFVTQSGSFVYLLKPKTE